MEQNEFIIVYNSGRFDLQSTLGKMPGFIWSKYPGEKHIIYKFNKLNKFSVSAYSYLRSQTDENIRLDENDKPKVGEEPVSPTDEYALYHDIVYRDTKKQDPEIALQMKHETDKTMIEQLDQVSTTGIIDKVANYTAKKLLQLKWKVGMGLTNITKLFVNSPIEEIYNKLNELHHRYKESERRMITIPSINYTHSCDIFEYGKVKIFTYFDCFSKKV